MEQLECIISFADSQYTKSCDIVGSQYRNQSYCCDAIQYNTTILPCHCASESQTRYANETDHEVEPILLRPLYEKRYSFIWNIFVASVGIASSGYCVEFFSSFLLN